MNEDTIKGYELAISTLHQFLNKKLEQGHGEFIARQELVSFSDTYIMLLKMQAGLIPMDKPFYADYIQSRLNYPITTDNYNDIMTEIESYYTQTTYVTDADNIINYMNNK